MDLESIMLNEVSQTKIYKHYKLYHLYVKSKKYNKLNLT